MVEWSTNSIVELRYTILPFCHSQNVFPLLDARFVPLVATICSSPHWRGANRWSQRGGANRCNHITILRCNHSTLLPLFTPFYQCLILPFHQSTDSTILSFCHSTILSLYTIPPFHHPTLLQSLHFSILRFYHSTFLPF